MATLSVPSISSEGNLTRYLQEIRKFPMLEPEQEYMLAKRWKEHEDPHAAHKLVTSHLRLVAKIAMGYRGYGLPLSELISEGNVGMMQAVKRFDPDRGFHFIEIDRGLDPRAHRLEGVGVLGSPQAAIGLLPGALRNIVADGVAEHTGHRVGFGEVLCLLADDDNQFAFVVDFLGRGGTFWRNA